MSPLFVCSSVSIKNTASVESPTIEDIENAFKRVDLLMQYHCVPYIMRFQNKNETPWKSSEFRGIYTQLARWCNQQHLYKKMSFRQFCVRSQELAKTDHWCAPYRAMMEFEKKYPDVAAKYFDLRYKFTIEQALSTLNPGTNKPFLVNYSYHPRFISLRSEERRVGKECRSSDLLEFLLFRRADIEKEAENKYAELERILDEMQAECDVKGEKIHDAIIFVSDGQLSRVLQILKSRKITAHKFTQAEGTEASSKYGGLSEREFLIQQFTKGKYQILVAIKCLDEGIDIPSAKTGIIMASSTNPREYVQRIGRIIRQAPGKSAAVLYDMILHPDLSGFRDDTLAAFEEKVFRKEMVRVQDLCANALNNAKIYKEIYSVLDNLRP